MVLSLLDVEEISLTSTIFLVFSEFVANFDKVDSSRRFVAIAALSL